MEDVHSGGYSDPPPVLPATPWAGPDSSSGNDGGGGGGSVGGSAAGGGEADAVPAEELAVPEDGSS